MLRAGSPHIHAAVRWLAVAAATVVAVAGLALTSAPQKAAAANLPGSILEGGFIISDAEFFDGDSMTAAQIQTFLNGRVSTCTKNYTCLKSYKADMAAKPADKYCKAVAAAKGVSAATIIAKVGLACGINPKVIIVMLQKEQGLVTSTAPSKARYDRAMGFNCPDTTGCSTTSLGFFTQVYGGARQLQVYTKNPNSFNYHPGKVNTIKWHPNSSCGTSKVYIQNQATANLYIYTPYRPNIAALAAGTGTGDSCSSYGNRNFYNYYVSWFAKGASASTGAPAQVSACTTPPSADVASASGTAVVNGAVNARKGPTLICSSGVTVLAKGTKVTVLGRYGMWTKAKIPSGDTRWIASSYLGDGSAPAPAGTSSACAAPAKSSIAAASGTVQVSLPASLDGLNARQAPSTSCDTGKILLKQGQKFARTGTYGVWWRITVSSKSYWAHSDYLKVVTSTSSTASSSVKVGQVMTVKSPVNLRTGASTSKKSLGVLKTGTKVTVLGSSGKWRKVVVGTRVGWSHGDYLTATSTVVTVKNTTVTKPVNLRTGASTSHKSLGLLKKGTKVTIYGSSGKWQKVVVGTKAGWAHGDYLAATAPSTSSSASAVKVGQVMTVKSPVNLRTGASTSKKSLGVLATGTKVTVLGSNGIWRNVVVGTRVGWSHGDYLKATSTVKSVKTMTVKSPVNLRTGPSTSKKSLGVLATGTKVIVYGSSGAWKQVVAGTRVGWSHGDYLK